MTFTQAFPLVNEASLPERRWARLMVSADVLIGLAKCTDWMTIRVTAHPLPDDARVVSIDVAFDQGVIYLIIESAMYHPVAIGEVPPTLSPPMWARWYGLGKVMNDAATL